MISSLVFLFLLYDLPDFEVFMELIKSGFFIFFSTFVLGIASFWGTMGFLAVLDAVGVINKYRLLPVETQEIILDIQCGKADPECRGLRCHS